jgi:hypothetical protein
MHLPVLLTVFSKFQPDGLISEKWNYGTHQMLRIVFEKRFLQMR